jgi:predicted ATP-binding protein involved in virulence
MITSIYFENFKALERFSISLKEFNILVGLNNSGKSTILDALRILQGAYRYASRKKPHYVTLPNKKQSHGWEIPNSSIPIQLENVQTTETDEPTIIRYRFAQNKNLFIHLSDKSPALLTYEFDGKILNTAISFRKEFDLNLAVIPTLSPFEIEEDTVENEYLNRWKGSRRASRLFRNIWYQEPDNFSEFRKMVEESWTGMSILPPEKLEPFSKRLSMFFEENRMTREICWAGFGFQVWLQLLTQIIKHRDAHIIVVDEPEIYLHPDLQHKILGILKNTNAMILLATHSAEIINEAEPNEVLVVDRMYKKAIRLTNLLGLQFASDLIGSNQNINLTRLARGKRILFVEGKDVKLLSKFSKVANYSGLFEKNNLTVIPIEGFSQNERVSGTNWTFSKIISEEVKLMALFDRDYKCDEEIEEFISRIKKDASYVHVLKRKEIENYLLSVKAIQNCINTRIRKRDSSKTKKNELSITEVEKLLFELSNDFKTDVYSQLAAHKYRYKTKKGIDLATVIKDEQKQFDENWKNLEYRFKVIPGKEFITALNNKLQNDYKISISYTQIISLFELKELDSDLIKLFEQIEKNAS